MLSSSSIRLLAILATTIVIAGCSNSSEPTPPAPLITTPKVGSTYTIDSYEKDSLGRMVPGSFQTTIRTITSTNATVEGKSNVVQYTDGDETTSLHFETNGDVAFFQPATSSGDQMPAGLPVEIPDFTIPARWVTFGYGSKAPMTIPSFDTTLMIDAGVFPLPVNLTATGTTSYIGTENLTTTSGVVATQKGLLSVTVNFSSLIASGSFKTVDTIWFAPNLGMFVKDDGSTTATLPDAFGGNQNLGGTFNVLTSYSLAQ